MDKKILALIGVFLFNLINCQFNLEAQVEVDTKRIFIKGYLPSSKQELDFYIDINADKTRFAKEDVSDPKITNIKEDLLTYNKKNDFFKYNLIKDNLIIGKEKELDAKQEMWVVDTYKSEQTLKNVLSFKITNREQDDFLLNLRENNITLNDMFSIYYMGDKSRVARLFIGVPMEGTYSEFVTKHKIIGDEYRLNLNKVFFGDYTKQEHIIKSVTHTIDEEYVIRDKYYKVENGVLLSSTEKYINVPKDFMYTIQDKMFKNKKECELRNENGYVQIYCYVNELFDLQDLPRINFVIGNYAFSFDYKMLFIKDNFDENIYKFVICSNDDNKDDYIFGYYFMKNYIISFYRGLREVHIHSMFNNAKVRFIEQIDKTLIILIAAIALMASYLLFLLYLRLNFNSYLDEAEYIEVKS